MSLSNWILVLIHVVIAPMTAAHALLYKRDSRSAFGWISVCLLFPLVGPILYGLFGVNRVRTRARILVDGGAGETPTPWLRITQERASVAFHTASMEGPLAPAAFPQSQIGARVSGGKVMAGNDIHALINGEQAYPAMLSAIGEARQRVYLCTYIFDNDSTGRSFVAAARAARERGVDVRVLVDGAGQHYSFPSIIRRLRAADIPAAVFLPPRLLPPSIHINLRNHRKVLVVDDRIGFTGGMNISDRHVVSLPGKGGRVHDVHFRVDGPVVQQLASTFLHDWAFATGGTSPSDDELPSAATERLGSASCRVITDGPDGDLDRLSILINGLVATARNRVLIMTPYFLPSRELVAILQSAAVRGVHISVVLPAHNNLPFVHWATQNMIWELLQFGIRIYYQPAPFNHAKLLVVDHDYTLVGSANLDPRSLRLNFELCLEVFDGRFANNVSDYFVDRISASHEATLAEVDARSLPVRLRDATCWLFSPYL